jgi:hypothetical protein
MAEKIARETDGLRQSDVIAGLAHAEAYAVPNELVLRHPFDRSSVKQGVAIDDHCGSSKY